VAEWSDTALSGCHVWDHKGSKSLAADGSYDCARWSQAHLSALLPSLIMMRPALPHPTYAQTAGNLGRRRSCACQSGATGSAASTATPTSHGCRSIPAPTCATPAWWRLQLTGAGSTTVLGGWMRADNVFFTDMLHCHTAVNVLLYQKATSIEADNSWHGRSRCGHSCRLRTQVGTRDGGGWHVHACQLRIAAAAADCTLVHASTKF
jgi:hypothetical protein